MLRSVVGVSVGVVNVGAPGPPAYRAAAKSSRKLSPDIGSETGEKTKTRIEIESIVRPEMRHFAIGLFPDHRGKQSLVENNEANCHKNIIMGLPGFSQKRQLRYCKNIPIEAIRWTRF
jgi:hypothetical protein